MTLVFYCFLPASIFTRQFGLCVQVDLHYRQAGTHGRVGKIKSLMDPTINFLPLKMSVHCAFNCALGWVLPCEIVILTFKGAITCDLIPITRNFVLSFCHFVPSQQILGAKTYVFVKIVNFQSAITCVLILIIRDRGAIIC